MQRFKIIQPSNTLTRGMWALVDFETQSVYTFFTEQGCRTRMMELCK